MDGVINTRTKTVHRHERGRTALSTACGLTTHVDPDRLRRMRIEEATDENDASRCGSCFEEAGGY